MSENKIMDLRQLGWNDNFEESFKNYDKESYTVGRVFAEHTHLYRIYTEIGEVIGEISGKMRFNAEGQEDFPAVGDWVVLTLRQEEMRATINGILPRSSKFSRKVAGNLTREQIVAANVDTIFLVMSLNSNYNLRRLERYLMVAWESGANPAIILSKADLCEDIDARLQEVEEIAFGVPVHVISSVINQGIDELNKYFEGGKTVALLGSSGVGKSTLLNHLAGKELQRVSETSELLDKGRHTTTHRELIVLDGGGLIIDTPGMKELQLWDGGEGVHETFEDIEALANECKFGDCSHNKEPGCAVKRAIEEGALSLGRYESYKKLERELKYAQQKQEQQKRIMEKRSARKASNGRGKF